MKERETFSLWDKEARKVITVEAKKVGKEWKAICPKHPDKKASLLINQEKEVYNCFGCSFQGHLYNSTKDLTRKPRKKTPTPTDYQEMEKKAQEYQGDIPQGIREARGLTDEIIEKYQIGYCKNHPTWPGHKRSITIPIYKDKKIVNIRYHSLTKDADPKILPYEKGLEYATWLYPEEQLSNDTLVFSEGELDALCCISQGIAAITRTCGATTWRPEFTKKFKAKTVYICQDCDEPGREGALKIARELSGIAREIRIVDLGLKYKGDLTNWFVTYGKSKEEIQKVIDKTPVYLGKEEEKEGKKKEERIFITGKQLVKEKVKELPAPVKGGLFVPERYTILAASDGEGKTLFCSQLSLSAITGTTFLGFFPVPKPAKVLYFAGENSRGDMQTKIRRQQEELEEILGRSIEKELDENFHWVAPLNINFFLNPKDKIELHAWLEDHRPDIVIFDPLADFISSNKSLSDDTLARVTAKTLTEIAQKYKCFPLLTTHLRKEAINPQTGRSIVTPENVWTFVFGSRFWLASAAAQIIIIRANLQRYPKAKKFCFKVKTAEPIEPLQVLRNPNLYYEELPSDKMNLASFTAQDIVEILERKCKGQQVETILIDTVAKELGSSKTIAKDLLKASIRQGLIYKDKKDNCLKISLKLEKELKI